MKTPLELFQDGEIQAAIEASSNLVKSKPTDVDARSMLCELLCFGGELERADKQLDAIMKLAPSSMPGVALMRHLIRSEMTRMEVYQQGRVPEFLVKPTESQQLRLKSLLALREGHGAEATSLIAAAGELDQEVTGKMNNVPFTGFVDLDDVLGPNLEVFTATGMFYWVEMSQLVSLEFSPVEHLTDMLWRAAKIETTGSVVGRVHIPVLYFGSSVCSDIQIKLGRSTEWVQVSEGEPVRGLGRREFLVGEEAVNILDIKSLSIEMASSDQKTGEE